MQLFNFLPASHHSSASPELYFLPHRIKIPVVDNTDMVGVTRESGELVALPVVVVVGHCIGEASNDGLGDIYNTKKS